MLSFARNGASFKLASSSRRSTKQCAGRSRHVLRTRKPAVVVKADGAPAERSDNTVSIPMPRIRGGAAYTFILAGFLKIMLFYIPGRSVVRTALGEITPYLMVPFGLALCLVGKVVCDLQLHDRAPKLVYAIIAAVVACFGAIAYHSYDWYETNRLAIREMNQGVRTESVRVGANKAVQEAQAAVERRAARDSRRLAMQLQEDGRKLPSYLKGEEETRGRLSVMDDPMNQAVEGMAEQAAAQRATYGQSRKRFYSKVGGE